jgi:hypothetical protein
MTGIALLVLVIVILAALTSGPQLAPPVVIMPQVQTGTGNRGAILFLLFLFLLLLLAEMAQQGG